MTEQGGADRAVVLAEVRALFLDGLEKTARGSGVLFRGAIEALTAGSGGFFDDMVSGGHRAGFEAAQDLTASKIRLVDDSQLELSIGLSNLARRIDEECAAAIFKLYQRFVTLLERPDMPGTDNPVAPEGICRGLGAMFDALGEGHDRAQERLAMIGERLVQDLPVLYAELNELMMRHRVRAARTQGQPERGERAGARRAGPGGVADPVGSLQQAMLDRMPGAARAAPLDAGGMAGAGSGGSATINPVAAAYGAAMFDQLIGQLGQWQRQGQADLFGGAAPAVTENALRALKAGEVGPMLRAPETATLDVLATIFDALFDDPQLADGVKASIARLQIPLLKAAILDPEFFHDRNHPARALLDTMAAAAAGLGPDIGSEHPVCVELRRVAVAVQAEFERDSEVFADHAAELESFMARRNHDIQVAAEAFVPLAQLQERRDLAALMAHRLVGTRAIEAAPPAIAEFLRGWWRQVLEAAWLAAGEEGNAWRDARSVVPELLSSVQAKPDADERKRMAMQIPGLLQKIRAGLDSIGVSAEERAPFLDACLAMQTAVLRGKAFTAETLAAEALHAEALSEPVDASAAEAGTLEMEGLTLKLVRPKIPSIAVVEDFDDDIAIGDWLEFQWPDAGRCHGRVCWISPTLGNPLLANQDWDYAVSVGRGWLERQLVGGKAKLGDGGSFFDRAAERALKKGA